MTTINRTVETDYDKSLALKLIESRQTPFTLSVTDGKLRTTAQNKLQRLWMNEISEQRGDLTPEEARGYCKLTIGVPILRSQNDVFAKEYDEVVKPLPYEHKLKLMMVPFDFGVTRLMTTKQKSEYLDGIIRHFGEQGIVLTMPEEMRHSNTEASDAPPPVSDDDSAAPSPATLSEPEGPPPQPSGSSSSDMFGKFNYEGDDLKNLREFAAKGIKEARKPDSVASVPAKLEFLNQMHPNYIAALVSADAVTALEAIKRALELVIEGERDIDRIEMWIESEFLSEGNENG